jgi:hypothetical protein
MTHNGTASRFYRRNSATELASAQYRVGDEPPSYPTSLYLSEHLTVGADNSNDKSWWQRLLAWVRR